MRSAALSLTQLLAILCLCLGFQANGISEENEHEHEHKEDSLHDLMESIGDDYKAVFKAVKKQGDKEAALEALDRLIKNTEAAKEISPGIVKKIEGEEAQKKMVDDYKKQMDVMIASITALKKSVTEEKWDEAMATIKSMKKHKGESHDKFQEDEEEEDH